MREIWFWQRIISPHMAGLARALARIGCDVRYVVEEDMSPERKALGWTAPPLDGVKLEFAREPRQIEACSKQAGRDSVHLCQGIRGNGLVTYAQEVLADRRLRQWVLMETVDDDGWPGPFKRATYAALLRWNLPWMEGVLALGHDMTAWTVARGVPAAKVFPFAYFLEDRPAPVGIAARPGQPYRVAYVGQFIERKCLPILVDAMASLEGSDPELVVVGSGPLGAEWKSYAEERLPGRVRWEGGKSSGAVLELLGGVHCLVLPSRHDGWGAVASEALMCGTPTICSDRCGVAGVVAASGVGGVFEHGNAAQLASLLASTIAAGTPSPAARARLSSWASSLGADSGARYLLRILAHVEEGSSRPPAPWMTEVPRCAA